MLPGAFFSALFVFKDMFTIFDATYRTTSFSSDGQPLEKGLRQQLSSEGDRVVLISFDSATKVYYTKAGQNTYLKNEIRTFTNEILARYTVDPNREAAPYVHVSASTEIDKMSIGLAYEKGKVRQINNELVPGLGVALSYENGKLNQMTGMGGEGADPTMSLAYANDGSLTDLRIQLLGEGGYSHFAYVFENEALTAIVNTNPAGIDRTNFEYTTDSVRKSESVIIGDNAVTHADTTSTYRVYAGTKNLLVGVRDNMLGLEVASYSYSSSGNLTESVSRGERVAFAYDEFDRLISEISVYGTKTFSYTPEHDIAEIVEFDGSIHQFTYDDLKNVLTDTVLSPEGDKFVSSYAYNTEGQLTSVSKQGVRVRSYQYDTQGRLIEDKPSIGLTKKFVYRDDETHLLSEDWLGSSVTRYTYIVFDSGPTVATVQKNDGWVTFYNYKDGSLTHTTIRPHKLSLLAENLPGDPSDTRHISLGPPDDEFGFESHSCEETTSPNSANVE